jgi:hypothetical protein
MRKKTMVFKALFSLIFSLFGLSSHAQDGDQIYFDTAQKMAAATTLEEMRAILDQNLPGFAAGLEKDATQNRDLVDLWGMSRNIDESHLADGTHTVPVNVLQYLNSIFNVNYDETYTFGHAGLTHTYGYLMSNLQTPYGFKRARYVGGEMEAGFGLPAGTFSGLPAQGTLLSNLTNFAAPIAFRDHPELTDCMNSDVAEIAGFDYSKLKPTRLVEYIENERFTLEIRTDIIPFTQTNAKGANTALLVYSIDFHAEGQNSQPRLITVFPVQSTFASGVFLPSGLGDQVAIKLNYNAALPINIPVDQMIGKRFIADENTTEHSSSRYKKKL